MIRVYLDEEKLLKVVSDLTDTPGYDGHLYKGIKISQDRLSGIHYAEISNITDTIPKALEGLFDFITLEEIFTVDAKRELGIYMGDDAKAELRSSPNSNHYILHIRSKKWKDLCNLHVAIRSGSIRPEQSYEKLQDGLSYAELEEKYKFAEMLKEKHYHELEDKKAELEMKEADLKQLQQDKTHYQKKFETSVSNLINLMTDLKFSWWSLCTKKRIIKAIEEILASLN